MTVRAQGQRGTVSQEVVGYRLADSDDSIAVTIHRVSDHLSHITGLGDDFVDMPEVGDMKTSGRQSAAPHHAGIRVNQYDLLTFDHGTQLLGRRPQSLQKAGHSSGRKISSAQHRHVCCLISDTRGIQRLAQPPFVTNIGGGNDDRPEDVQDRDDAPVPAGRCRNRRVRRNCAGKGC